MPAKWYSGGRGLDSFRQSMLSDRSISHLFDFIDSHDCFTKVDIAGGVCYFLRDKFYNGNCVVSTIRNGKTTVVTRNLNELDVFVRTKEELDILDKIKSNTESFMSDVVLAQKPFGLRTYETPLSEGDIVLRYNKGKGLYLRKRIEQIPISLINGRLLLHVLQMNMLVKQTRMAEKGLFPLWRY